MITEESNNNSKRNNDTSLTTGVVLISLGVLFLISKYFPSINFVDIWPFLLIVVGVLIIIRGKSS